MTDAASPADLDHDAVFLRLVHAYAAFQADAPGRAGDPGFQALDATVDRLIQARATVDEIVARHASVLAAAEARFAQAQADGLEGSDGWAALQTVRADARRQHAELLQSVRANDAEILRLAMLIEAALPGSAPLNRAERRAAERARRRRLH